MTAYESAVDAELALLPEMSSVLDEQTLRILERRRRTAIVRRRGWLVRRMLLLADVAGLLAAFALAELLLGRPARDAWVEYLVFAVSVPAWVVLAKLHALYDRDEERTEHSTVDETVGVFHLLTTGTTALLAVAWIFGPHDVRLGKFFAFWGLGLAFVVIGRSIARTSCHRNLTYLQNTLIVGAGDVGQLVARKILQHPEYGINLVGFVDAEPKERRPDLSHLTLLGPPERLPALIRLLDVERVIIAYSNESHAQTLELIRSLKDRVQVDIVPRLFEVLGPNVGIHSVEGLPLIGLPPARISRSSRLIKRAIDVTGALVGLTLSAPLFIAVAIAIKRDSPGPVFFRQRRLGLNMRPFDVLKFRTMKVGTTADEHRDYIKATMQGAASPESNGLYKRDRADAITAVGRWLRKTSLDELPQLINVLRGDMSLVGPRPCIDYETEVFEPHHFERFSVPAGITGLWQVTGRARTTFREALDMDVAYVRGWSLGLDVRLLFLTPLKAFMQKGTA